MKSWKEHIAALVIVTIPVFGFFWRLFWPAPSFIMTQDFGRSDIWHAGLPYRYFLWESLRQGTLPLWNPYQGGGFPVFSESISGALFIPNIIAFTLFDFITAYNLTLVCSFIMLGWGTYLFLRTIRLSHLASLFGGITLMFGGLPFAQISHIMILQSMSMLPWVMIATLYLLKTPSYISLTLLAFSISQQLFAGFPQISFITLLLSFSYVCWLSFRKRIHLAHGIFWITACVVSGLLSAVQLLPSAEFLKVTANPGGFSPHDAMYFSFPFKHLLSFMNPFAFGSPANGTYPPFYQFSGSLFWENTAFIGWLPCVLLVYLYTHRKTLTKYNTQSIVFFLFVLGMSFLLMTGSHSPLYIVFALWPFNLFRVPSRFLWSFTISAVVLASIALDRFLKHRTTSFRTISIVVIIGLLHILQITSPWYAYNPYVDAKDWLSEPPIVSLLRQNNVHQVVSIGAESVHNHSFLKQGWSSMNPYWELRDALVPTSNSIWHINGFKVYAGRFLSRQTWTDSLFDASIDSSNDTATTSATTTRLMALFGIDALINVTPTFHTDLIPIATTSASTFALTLYTPPVRNGLPYIATSTAVITTLKEAAKTIQDASFDPLTMGLVEKPLGLAPLNRQPQVLHDKKIHAMSVYTVVDNPTESLLVTRETYYPGWVAVIDGNRKVDILPVNIQYRGVIVPPGTHTITFTYSPLSLTIGATISGMTCVILLLLTVWQIHASNLHRRS